MTNLFPYPCFSAMEPAASLTSVRVRRRNVSASPSGKRGDLTEQQGEPQAMQASAPVEMPVPLEVAPPPALEMAPPAPAPEPLAVVSEMPALEMAPPPPAPEPLVIAGETPAPEIAALPPAPVPFVIASEAPAPVESPTLMRQAPAAAEPLILTRETLVPAQPLIRARETAAPAEPLTIARETPAPTQGPLFASRNTPAPAPVAVAPTAPAATPVEPLTQPALEEKLARLDAPKPVTVTPTPSLPPAAEREAALPQAEVMLPELAATTTPNEPVKTEPEAWNDAWTRIEAKHEESAPLEATIRIPEPVPALTPGASPSPVSEPAIAEAKPVEPQLFLVPRAVEPEPDNEPKFKPLSEPKLNVPMAAGPKAVIDLLSIDAPSAEPTPAPAPMPAPVASEAAGAQSAAANDAANGSASADDILEYWDALRGAQDLPVLKDLDRGRVANTWPNTVLLAFPALEEPARITRVGDNNGDVEYTAMVTDWILTRGRNSAKRGQPMEEEQRFPVSGGGRARYRLLMLPFASEADGGKSEHVLCHITRAQDRSAVDSFKRWLAS